MREWSTDMVAARESFAFWNDAVCDAFLRVRTECTHRSVFREALTWMEIHGDMPDVVEHWITVLAERGADEPVARVDEADRPQRRRRRRRRRFRPAP